MKPDRRKILLFVLQFIPLFAILLWLYGIVVPEYQPLAVGAAEDRQPQQSAAQLLPRVAQATGLAPAKGSYLVQLGSFTSTKGTSRAWAKLKKAHPELLGDMSLFIQEATVNDRAYYRVQAGPIPNQATAQDMCAQLKARQQDCLVVRR